MRSSGDFKEFENETNEYLQLIKKFAINCKKGKGFFNIGFRFIKFYRFNRRYKRKRKIILEM